MYLKIMGALLTLAACGYIGLCKTSAYKHQERMLQQLIHALEFMENELQYRMPDLPQLCGATAGQCKGPLRDVFISLSKRLEEEILPDAAGCMDAVLDEKVLPAMVREKMRLLGKTLGRFDLPGQLSGIASVKELASRDLSGLASHRKEHNRICQTLAMCAGAALVILLI